MKKYLKMNNQKIKKLTKIRAAMTIRAVITKSPINLRNSFKTVNKA